MTRQAVTTFFTCIIALLSTLAAQQGETISNYDVRLEIDPQDASLFVTETITVSVRGDRIKHGIYRDFPTLNKGAFGFRRPVGFDVISTLRNGERENFTIEGLKDGKRVRIGNPGKKLEHGTHTYTLDYRTTGQLRSFSAHDELYWNATGHFWDFSISNAKVTVVLPDGAEIIVDDDIRPAAYIGQPGGGETRQTTPTHKSANTPRSSPPTSPSSPVKASPSPSHSPRAPSDIHPPITSPSSKKTGQPSSAC